MKRLFILLLGLVLTMPIDSTLNATEPMDTAPQTTSDGWEKIGRVAIYKAESFQFLDVKTDYKPQKMCTSHYALFVGEGEVYIKNIQGFKSTRIVFNNQLYYPSNQRTSLYKYKFSSFDRAYDEGKTGTTWYNYKLGEYYYCNL